MKLSLIIPHYNCFNLLQSLMDELIKQLTDEVEVFIIDDSDDKRIDIYESDNVYVYHFTERQGVSKARNFGIKLSVGEYIGFIDADDLITQDYINELLLAIKYVGSDIINFNWYDINKEKEHKKPDNYAVWKEIYKREFVPYFDESLTHKEDVKFQKDLEKKNWKSKYYLDTVLYLYNSGRKGSLYWEEKNLLRGEEK